LASKVSFFLISCFWNLLYWYLLIFLSSYCQNDPGLV
jgi:hypothetical protein